MAEALTKSLTSGLMIASAGTHVTKPGQTLYNYAREHPRHCFTIDVMLNEGLDVSRAKRTQLTPALAGKYNMIISMAEPAATPAWLAGQAGFVHWNVKDPGGKSLQDTEIAYIQIRKRVLSLLANLNSTK